MVSGRARRSRRLGVGQLLVRLLRHYRDEALALAEDLGYSDIRGPHLQHVLANVGRNGLRLTELATLAQLSLSTTSELVSELELLGYLQRRNDPEDGRAKVIVLSSKGRRAFEEARDHVPNIEQHWATLVGKSRFDEACRVLQEILDELQATWPAANDVRESQGRDRVPASQRLR